MNLVGIHGAQAVSSLFSRVVTLPAVLVEHVIHVSYQRITLLPMQFGSDLQFVTTGRNSELPKAMLLGRGVHEY